MWRRSPRVVPLVLWALLGALSGGFAFTEGLAYSDPGVPITHVRQLQSSGSDDDLCIELGAVFGLGAVVWSGLRMRRRFSVADLAVNGALLGAQAAYLLAIEAGSIQQTLARDRNWVLGAWLATFTALAIWTATGVVAARERPKGPRAP